MADKAEHDSIHQTEIEALNNRIEKLEAEFTHSICTECSKEMLHQLER